MERENPGFKARFEHTCSGAHPWQSQLSISTLLLGARREGTQKTSDFPSLEHVMMQILEEDGENMAMTISLDHKSVLSESNNSEKIMEEWMSWGNLLNFTHPITQQWRRFSFYCYYCGCCCWWCWIGLNLRKESQTLRSQSETEDPLHLMFHAERRWMGGRTDGRIKAKQSRQMNIPIPSIQEPNLLLFNQFNSFNRCHLISVSCMELKWTNLKADRVGGSQVREVRRAWRSCPGLCDMPLHQHTSSEGRERMHWLESPGSQRNSLDQKEKLRIRSEHAAFKVHNPQG